AGTWGRRAWPGGGVPGTGAWAPGSVRDFFRRGGGGFGIAMPGWGPGPAAGCPGAEYPARGCPGLGGPGLFAWGPGAGWPGADWPAGGGWGPGLLAGCPGAGWGAYAGWTPAVG